MPMDIGESKVSASVAIGETFVIHPEEMQDCSLKIVNGDNIVGDLFAKFITGSMNHSSFDAAGDCAAVTSSSAEYDGTVVELGRAAAPAKWIIGREK